MTTRESVSPPIEGPLPGFMGWQSVSPLVGTKPTESIVARPSNVEECRATIEFCKEHGLTLCPRGSAHSYGDQPLNDRNVLLSTRRMNRVLALDEERGTVVVEPGARILDVFREAHAKRFTLRASPSEATITVAGAISSNVNGKDSWRAGNFGDQVVRLKLLTATGEILSIDRTEDADLFRGVVGGMGLLGILVEATLRLERIATPFVDTSRVPVRNVDGLLAELARTEKTSDFAVVWLDVYARGESLGRGVVHSTQWMDPSHKADRFADEIASGLDRLERGREKALLFHRVLNVVTNVMLHFQRVSVRLFNFAYWTFSKVRERLPGSSAVELFMEYNFFPNLQIPPAAMLCGPHGYTIQISFPRDRARDAIRDLISICHRMPCPPVTTVMRLHRKDDHLISFSEDGYSLNFEFHPKSRHPERMRPHIDELIRCTIGYGGKVHLAKDMILSAEQFRGLFPGYEEFLEMKRRLDPEGLFASEMYRRLFVSPQ